MAQAISTRVTVETTIRDSAAFTQSLNQCVLITKNEIFGKKLFEVVGRDGYVDQVDSTLWPAEALWLQTFFRQPESPLTATILYWDTARPFIEVLQEAYDYDTPMYFLSYIGSGIGDIEDQIEIALASGAIEDRFMTHLLTTDINAESSTNTTHLGARLNELKLKNTVVYYQPLITKTKNQVEASAGVFETVFVTADTSKQRPDAGQLGRLSNGVEGLKQWALKDIEGFIPVNLKTSIHAALKKVHYNYVTTYKRSNFNSANGGRTVTGREIRVHWGVDWFDITLQVVLFNMMANNDATLRDDDTFAVIESLIRQTATTLAEDHNVIFEGDTFTVNMPDPMRGKTLAEILSGSLKLDQIYDGVIKSGIDDIHITGNLWLQMPRERGVMQ